MASSLVSESGVDNVGEDEHKDILDLLNFKVVEKSPSDPGYFDNSLGLYPSKFHPYTAEYTKLQTELNCCKFNANESEKLVEELKEKLGRCGTENGKLKRKVTAQQKRFASAKCKQKDKIKSLKATQKSEIAQINKENRKLLHALKQDNERMQNELADKTYELNLSDRRMEGHQKLLDIEELNHQNSQMSFKNKITDLECKLMEKTNENEKLATALSTATREKDDAVNLWQKLSESVKSCNDDLEVKVISSVINKCHLSFPTEIPIGEVSAQPEKEGNEEKRLNINTLSRLFQNTSKICAKGHEETKDIHEPQQNNSSLSSSASSSLSSSILPGSENKEDRRDKAAAVAHIMSESIPSTRNVVEGENDQLQESQFDDPYYLPIVSPITPVGSFPENSSPSRDNL